ncbi:MAG: CCA tRNA nucleotidyltransferase [Anaerolineae bacterium]|nr:CCA tRNA nucleotidyltransferase [Anaerolineae bacterium]
MLEMGGAARRVDAAARGMPLVEAVFDLAEAQGAALYLVGGTVRDMLLGRETHDLDFAVDGDGLRIARYVADRLGGAYVSLDPERRTGRVVLRGGTVVHTDGNAVHEGEALSLDLASFRGPDLEADLRDRDLTINAMAVRRASDGSYVLVDPLGGVADLHERRLRATSPHAFGDDPVRTLRAVRLAVQFDCQIEPQTRRWLMEAVPGLPAASAERVRDEWCRTLEQRGAGDAVEQMVGLGLLAHVAPPLAALVSVKAPHPAAAGDALSHGIETLRAVERLVGAFGGHADREVTLPAPVQAVAPQLAHRYASPICDERTHEALLKCAALLHRVALSQQTGVSPPSDGAMPAANERAARIAAESATIATELARWWRLSNAEVQMLRVAIAMRPRAARLAREGGVDRRAIYRYYRDAGEHGIDAAALALGTVPATGRADGSAARWQHDAEQLSRLWHAFYFEYRQVVNPPPLLSGRDLMQLGMTPGPQMGELIGYLREEQAAGEIGTRGEAVQAARGWLRRADAGGG